jgi:hypothetical protein
MSITTVGLDIAKQIFQVHGADTDGRVVLRKKLRRNQVAAFFANLPPCVVGLEACCGSHYWARVLSRCGHWARLIAPQFVKPYVKSNKNDANDAEAICEAVSRPQMRFVSTKSVEQQDIQSLHRVRSRLVSWRTGLANQIRGLLSEYGIVLPQRVSQLRRGLPLILEDATNELANHFQPTPVCFSLRRTVVSGRKDHSLGRANRSRVSSQRAVPTCSGGGRDRAAHRDGSGGRDERRKSFQERPAVRGLVGSGTATAFQRWKDAPVRDQQARRSLPADAIDPRSPLGGVSRQPQD